MALAFLREWTGAGARDVHRRLMLRRWLAGMDVGEGATRGSEQFPAAMIAKLPDFSRVLASLAQVVSRHPSSDGSTRLLIRLADGRTVESVLLGRGGLCISTQIGC